MTNCFVVCLLNKRGNHCCLGRAESIAHSECVSVALDILQTKRKHRIILKFEAYLALPYYPTVYHYHTTDKIFGIKGIEHKIYVLIFSITLKYFFIIRRIQRYMIINVHMSSSCKVPIILVGLKKKILGRFSKNFRISNFMKILKWEPVCSTWKDRRTDRHDETNSRFS
jgi:hypothetical protein